MIYLECLIVFTRYPEAGKTKTRLIPALGAEGAAQVQQEMTEHTMRQVRELECRRSCTVEMRFAGGDRTLMQTWLGLDLNYQPQGEGDLGARMARAFQVAFEGGAEWVVTIGTDCPGLDAPRLGQAFEALQQHDLVLGPATDGGYYLIGLSRFIPALFVEVDWGTAAVLQQTVAIAQSLNLSMAYLEPLSDVDYPDDLAIWEAVQQATCANPSSGKISVIIPVLNEAKSIQQTLSRLQETPGLEIIVADGGSQDQTVVLAAAYGVQVVHSQPGRAYQMNAGARVATGEVLVFLHADTQLPNEFPTWVWKTLKQPGIMAGAFELRIDGTMPGLQWIEWGVKWRSHLFQLPYGDQGIFLKADTFWQVGGFPELPIMEDFELMRRLRKLGRVAIAPVAVQTSGRRWEKLGVLRTTLINQLVIIAYFLGVSPKRLAQWYRNGFFSR